MARKKSTSKKPPRKKTKVNKIANQKINPKLIIGLILLGVGLLLLNRYQEIQTAKKDAQIIAQKMTISNEPIKASDRLIIPRNTKEPLVRLLIAKREIDVPIVESEIVNGYWEVSEIAASHGLGSAYPGMKGNTVIFAHARQGLFLNLKNAEEGDEILILSKNKWHKYKINSIKEVIPNEIEVVLPTTDERLTLFTCSGFADEKRLIVIAIPVK